MGKPRILVDALSVSLGGGRTYVANLLPELARDDRGFEFTLLAQPGALEGIDTSPVEVAWLRLPALPGVPRVVLRVLYEELLLPLRARAFDLLYCIADLSPPWGRTPRVVLMRNLNIYDRRWYDDGRTRTLERLARWGAPGARRVIFPSRAAAEAICPRVGVDESRVEVVPYGVSPDVFEGVGAPGGDARYLFLAAAPERHKNLMTLIEALPRVADRELELWIAGRSLLDPAHQRELEDRARALGVGARVRFLGEVPYRDVLGYCSGAVAFVFPSFIETFGHPVLEAMLAETPLVLSEIPAFREIAGDAALYFPPRDADALAQAIDRVQADPAGSAERVARGRARVREFSWARSVDGLCRVFHEALSGA